MLRPSGWSWRTWTLAPRRPNTSGATSDAAPLAQSSTRVRPSRAPSGNAPTSPSTYRSQPASAITVPTPSPVGPGSRAAPDVSDPPPTPRRRSISASSRASTSSLSLRPPAAKNLMPLSWKGLWEAEMTAAGWPSAAESQATPGVGSTPTSATRAPSAMSPADRAAWRSGPEIRVSRPIRKRSPARTRAAARPRATTTSGVRSALATPRTPSVPNRRDRRGPAPLALGVLGSLPGLLQAVLLALLLT